MKVALVTAVDAPWSQTLLADLGALARRDRYGTHEVVAEPDNADVIVFVDCHQYPSSWAMRLLGEHPLVRAYPERSFVYDERDLPRDVLPGIYVALPRRRFNPSRHRAFAYSRLPTQTRGARERGADLLFSFLGRRAGPVRERVLGLSHPRAIVEETSHHDFFGESTPSRHEAQQRYVEVVSRSKFVLCPRGAGTSSLRLFETLAAGRVPVVISDEWVAPAGIDWSTCSVRSSEREIGTLASRLEALEDAWPAMSTAAARVYDEWFSPDVWFHRAAELCGELLEQGHTGVARQWTQLETWRAAARQIRLRASQGRA